MIKGIVFDMDGVLRIGNEPIEGVNEVFKYLKQKDIPFMISTNECRYSPDELRDDLNEMGINIDETTPIYTAGLAVKDYMETKLQRFPNERFSIGVVGEAGLFRVLNELSSHQHCDFADLPPKFKTKLYLIVGTVDKIKISTLEKVRKWVNANCKIITTCCDMSDPSSKGDFTLGMPNHLLHMVSFQNVNYHKKSYSTGKPHPIHAKAILKRFPDCKPSEILFVGDTIYTDIRLAEENGFKSALVLSGNTKKEGVDASVIESDYVLESIRDIPNIL